MKTPPNKSLTTTTRIREDEHRTKKEINKSKKKKGQNISDIGQVMRERKTGQVGKSYSNSLNA